MTKKLLSVFAAFLAVIPGAIFFSFSPSFAQDHMRIGYLPATGHAKLFVAKEKGFFSEDRLLGHNPAAALYTTGFYYKKLLEKGRNL